MNNYRGKQTLLILMAFMALSGLHSWDYGDKVMFGNVASLINKDMTMTSKLNEMGMSETNPVLQRNIDNKDMLQVWGFLNLAILGNRWLEIENPAQRKMEMLLAQAVEAYCLNNGGRDWVIQYGLEL
jgi:hypothetical protein